MSGLPISERLVEALDGIAPFQLDDEGFARAAAVFQRARGEAERRQADCAPWAGAGRHAWREPEAALALRRRTISRSILRITRAWLGEALNGWRPGGEGH